MFNNKYRLAYIYYLAPLRIICMIFKYGRFVFLMASMVYFSSSCINTKSITYFNNLPIDSTYIQLQNVQSMAQEVHINDLLQIRIGGDNEKIVAYINQYFGQGAGSFQIIVNADGEIEMPRIGKIKVVGLTRDQAAAKIASAYSEYIIGVIVSVEYVNFRFVILGEVQSPGYFSIPNERINIFEALAQAGDMTQFAMRENVKLIREQDGKREVISLNFSDRSILNSPWYYLNRNDIIYVAPRQAKATIQNIGPTASIVASILSFTALIFTIIRK